MALRFHTGANSIKSSHSISRTNSFYPWFHSRNRQLIFQSLLWYGATIFLSFSVLCLRSLDSKICLAIFAGRQLRNSWAITPNLVALAKQLREGLAIITLTYHRALALLNYALAHFPTPSQERESPRPSLIT